MAMTPEERDEGGRALAAVIIGPNVSWDVLSDAVRERYMRAYEAAVATHERADERPRGRCANSQCRRPVFGEEAYCLRCRLGNIRRVG